MSEEPKLRGRAKLVVGALFAAMGIIPILAALGVADFAEGKNAPDWVVGLAGFMFILGGGAIWAQGTYAEKLVGNVVGTVLLVGLAAIGNWVAFGVGERSCTVSSTSWLFTRERGAVAWECRAAFGLGAALLDGVLLIGAAKLLESRLGRRPWVALLEKFAKGILLLALSPFLLVLIVIVVIKSGKEALLEGKWFKGRDRE